MVLALHSAHLSSLINIDIDNDFSPGFRVTFFSFSLPTCLIGFRAFCERGNRKAYQSIVDQCFPSAKCFLLLFEVCFALSLLQRSKERQWSSRYGFAKVLPERHAKPLTAEFLSNQTGASNDDL